MFRAAMRVAAAGATLLAMALPAAALATGVIESVKGEVRAGSRSGLLPAARPAQRLQPGTRVTTGASSFARLRFDDGQTVLLDADTEFRIVDYKFIEGAAQDDEAQFDLLRGAARFVTGRLGKRTKAAFALRAPQATIGLQGTDFMVALQNGLYLRVTQGSVAVSNAGGTASFDADAAAEVRSSTKRAEKIESEKLPAAAADAFKRLAAVEISGYSGHHLVRQRVVLLKELTGVRRLP